MAVLPDVVTNANDPLLVAMGLPDDHAEAMRILTGRRERLVAACMGGAGFDYQPEIDDEISAANALSQNALSIEERQRWTVAYGGEPTLASGTVSAKGCFAEASERVYLLNAFADTLGAYLMTINDDPLVVAATALRQECRDKLNLAEPGPGLDQSAIDADASCDAEMLASRAAALRRVSIEYLELHYDEIRSFGETTANL